jgi:hypothetical protein
MPVFLLTFMLACAVPGLQSGPVPAAPTADSTLLATIVAETVSAAILQTEQALTPTPVPTATLPVTVSHSLLVIQQDSSTLYVDQRAGYQITIPFGWLAVRVNEPEYRDSFSLAVAANQYVQASLQSIQGRDPDTFRLFAFDVREDHVQKQFVTNLNFVWDPQSSISLDTDEQLKAGAAQSAQSLPGLEVLSTAISSTSSGIPVGLIESKLPTQNASGADILIFQKQVIFNAKTGLVVITLSTGEGLKDSIFPEVDAMLETIQLVAE